MIFRENRVRVIRWCRCELVAALVLIISFPAGLCSATNISDCGEAEVPFPVQFTGADTPGSKAHLTKTIRKNVLTGSNRIQDGSRDLSVAMLSSLLDKEYRCNTGVALTTKEAEELLSILHQMYQETLTQGGVKPRTANRLSSLQEEIGRRGSHSSSCSKAASELAQLVTTTTKEALTEKQEYETALRQREARIGQCRKVALAGKQSDKAAAEVRRKQEAIELQKAEEQKLKAEMDRKRQQEDLERQEKEAQKEDKRKAEAEALELHKKKLVLQKEHEEKLKAEAEAHKRQADELERQEEVRRKQEAIELLKAEEQKLKAEVDRKRQQEDLERQEKEAQKEQKLKAEAEALELHKKTLALQKAREEQLKAEAETHKRQTEELERQEKELRSKVERDRQLEAEKDRQREVQRQIDADRERKVKEDRGREEAAAQERQKQVQDQIAAERERQAKIKAGIEQAQGVQEEARRVQPAPKPTDTSKTVPASQEVSEPRSKPQVAPVPAQPTVVTQPAPEPVQPKPAPAGKPISEITWSDVRDKFIDTDSSLTDAQKKHEWQKNYENKWVRWSGDIKDVKVGWTGTKVFVDMGTGSLTGLDLSFSVKKGSKDAENLMKLNKGDTVTFIGRLYRQPGSILAMFLEDASIE